MAQARRIKPKSTKSKNKRRLPRLPWGLMFVILLSGIVLLALFNGARTGDTNMGAGLNALFAESTPTVSEDQEIAALIETRSSRKEFEFYELLRDIEKVMPDDLPESVPTQPRDDLDFFLQAASFKEHQDAEELRAKLALKGFKSVTQAREVEGKGTYYRVRLGPYADRRKAKNAKTKLQKLGVRPLIYSVQK